MTPITTDTVVDGRYRVMHRIGSGGMADVWCAEDLQLGRKVALKLLHARFAEDQEFVERFRREASSAAGLQHPNVVSVYDRGEWEGTYYIAMEFLEGEPLKDLIDREAPLDPDRAIDLTAQILRAARFAHRRGIIHRDLKPHNVIVDSEGRAKVADFGIARAGASDMTETGALMGTAHYLSPEQAQGHAVTETSDLYSVGIILYELLTGRVPFEGDAAVTIALKQVSEEPAPPSHFNQLVTPEIEAVVLHALAKDPAARFRDADEFMAALEAVRPSHSGVIEGAPTTAFGAVGTGSYPAVGYVPPPQRRWWLWGLLAAVLIAGAIIAALLLTDKDTEPVPRVVGADVASAARRLRNDGFKPVVERIRNDQPRDRVIGQDPLPGVRLELGDEVTLTVSDGPGTAAVPDIAAGTPRVQAIARLRATGFRVRERRESSDDVREGLVIRTQQSPGSQLERGSTVTLVISRGPEQVTVPRVVGRQLDDARSDLEEADLEVDVTREESEDEEPGTVLRQDPEPGSEVDAGTSVTLVVAEEPTQVAIPDVEGQNESEAVAALSGRGLQVDVQDETVTSPSEDGKVLRQSPGSGRRVDRGRRVTIVVGRFDDSGVNPDPEPDPGTTTGEQPPPEQGGGMQGVTNDAPPAR